MNISKDVLVYRIILLHLFHILRHIGPVLDDVRFPEEKERGVDDKSYRYNANDNQTKWSGRTAVYEARHGDVRPEEDGVEDDKSNGQTNQTDIAGT